MKLIEAIGLRIDGILASRRITVYGLAKMAGMGRSTVWKIVHPDLLRVKTVKIDTLWQIADALGMSLKDFFDDPLFDGAVI